jgi:ribonucleotide monophosphatase NagD (HAD superfamily)
MQALLIDLSGTLHIEDTITDGAIDALKQLQSRKDIAIKFVTNTTKVFFSIIAKDINL